MARSTVKRAFKYRFYPTDAQAGQLPRTFGCVRLVYNRALAERTTAWFTQQRRITYNQASAALTEWKKDPGVSELLRQARPVPAVQGPQEVQGVGGVLPVGVHLPRRATHLGEDERAVGHRVVAAAARGCAAHDSDSVQGQCRALARVDPVRG